MRATDKNRSFWREDNGLRSSVRTHPALDSHDAPVKTEIGKTDEGKSRCAWEISFAKAQRIPGAEFSDHKRPFFASISVEIYQIPSKNTRTLHRVFHQTSLYPP